MILKCGKYTLEGYSRSTIETYVKVHELNIAFDIGKCPFPLVFVPKIFISHFHGDHSTGLPYYVAHRNLAKLETGQIYIPAATETLARQLIETQAGLEQARRHYNLIPLEAHQEFEFKRNFLMKTFPTYHRIPSLGYQVIEQRMKLKPEYHGLSGPEIVELKKKGVEITSPLRLPLITYIGDSTIEVFDKHPFIGDSEILLTECTFLAPEHRKEAYKRKHIHIDDLVERLPNIKSKYVVLMHFSMRYTHQEIQRMVRERVPREEQERILVLL